MDQHLDCIFDGKRLNRGGPHTPRQSKCLSKIVKIVMEGLGNVIVDGVVNQGKITCQHSRLAELAWDKGIRVNGGSVECFPLSSTSRAFD